MTTQPLIRSTPRRVTTYAVAALLAFSLGIGGWVRSADAAVPTANQLMFSYSLNSFLTVKAAHPAPYNWSDDGCSAKIFSSIVNAYFNDQCKRHDFGYRNWRRITGYSGTSSLRLAIDNKLYSDMKDRCSHFSIFNPLRGICYDVADAAYVAVRLGGSLN